MVRHSVWFFTTVANIFADRAVNNKVIFLSSNLPSKRLIPYRSAWISVKREHRGHRNSPCSHSSSALCVCSPETALLSLVPPHWNGLSQVKGFLWLPF